MSRHDVTDVSRLCHTCVMCHTSVTRDISDTSQWCVTHYTCVTHHRCVAHHRCVTHHSTLQMCNTTQMCGTSQMCDTSQMCNTLQMCGKSKKCTDVWHITEMSQIRRCDHTSQVCHKFEGVTAWDCHRGHMTDTAVANWARSPPDPIDSDALLPTELCDMTDITSVTVSHLTV